MRSLTMIYVRRILVDQFLFFFAYHSWPISVSSNQGFHAVFRRSVRLYFCCIFLTFAKFDKLPVSYALTHRKCTELLSGRFPSAHESDLTLCSRVLAP